MVRKAERTESTPARLRLGISTCLLGEEVRHDGGHKRDLFLLNGLGPYVEWVPVCPELEMGMGVPRDALRLVGDPEGPRLITIKTGIDHTAAMNRWAKERLGPLTEERLDGYVFKSKSPSCGVYRVRVYGKGGMPIRKGRGLFAAALMRLFPLLPIEEEGRLHDAALRENFIDRLYAYHRFRQVMEEEPKPRALVAFHTSHKLTVMSHDPRSSAELGRLVASAGKRKIPRLLKDYGALLMATLAKLATRRKHTNVLQHLMGYLKKDLDADDKSELVELLEDYRLGRVPLIVPITLLKHHIRRHEVPDWVHRQVYLNPYPEELMLRNQL
jgi:uncharacterized protein YbgA (DUF1722 family)/uncharacterized protein YbbK (DUF523 family)